MDAEFRDLERLAQQPIESEPEASLWADAARQYEQAPLHELFELLESAVESYAVVRSTLPPRLRICAEQEIEFFLSLLQERLNLLLESTRMRPLQRPLQPVSSPVSSPALASQVQPQLQPQMQYA